MARTGKHRPHKPHVLGPRLERPGRYWTADLRPWGGNRFTSLRDPKHPDWPDAGERTEDRAEAEQWKWSYVSRLQGEGKDRRAGRKSIPLKKALSTYNEHRSRSVGEQTVRGDNAILAHLLNTFKNVPVHRITPESLQEMFDGFRDEGYAVSTLHTRKHDLSAFFKWLGGSNPAKEIVLPPVETTDDPYAWSDEEVGRLREEADGWLRVMLEVGLGTGARLGELLALRWSDFNPETKTVRIVRQFRNASTKVVGLKGKRSRTALVLPFLWDFYEDGIGHCVTRDGKPLKSHQIYEPFRALTEAAGVDGQGRGPHDTRRTYGRLFLEAGGWMDELQRSLGHASIRTTEQQYGRFQAEVAAEFARQRIYGEGRLRRLR